MSKSYFDAWNHCDPVAIADHLTADGIYLDVPENKQQTHDQLVDYLNKVFDQRRDNYELLGEIVTGKNTIAFQYRATPVDNSGTGDNSLAYCGAEFMTLNGDAAMTITDYYDIPGLAKTNKYAKSGLRDDQMREYKQRLEVIMVGQRAYLEPNLTLPALAEMVGCSVNHLSQVINAGFGVSFFDYLNGHRVRHAQQMLEELNDRTQAVLNIAFNVGFNSNSAFYAAFKKHVGMTPAQYRRTGGI